MSTRGSHHFLWTHMSSPGSPAEIRRSLGTAACDCCPLAREAATSWRCRFGCMQHWIAAERPADGCLALRFLRSCQSLETSTDNDTVLQGDGVAAGRDSENQHIVHRSIFAPMADGNATFVPVSARPPPRAWRRHGLPTGLVRRDGGPAPRAFAGRALTSAPTPRRVVGDSRCRGCRCSTRCASWPAIGAVSASCPRGDEPVSMRPGTHIESPTCAARTG